MLLFLGIFNALKEMLSYLRSMANSFEKFYLKLGEISFHQLDINANQKVVVQFEKNLLHLVFYFLNLNT